MTTQAQRAAAKAFVHYWMDKGYEKGETASFWTMLLQTVFGIETPQAGYILFEHQVQIGHTSFIDAYIPSAKVIIEQKGKHVDLTKAVKQSDGTELTPFRQAKRYADELPYSEKPRWIIVSNFQQFHVYDMEQPHSPPANIYLGDLPKELHRLSFLVDDSNIHLQREMTLSIEAGKLVGRIYDAIRKHYIDPDADETFKSLNKLCVRIVFCLYAEDAGLFKKKDQFHDYLSRFSARDFRKALIELFEVLDTEEEQRDPYLDPDLATFPYVSGGLFNKSEAVIIPQFDDEVRTLILSRASDDFDWSEISPTIFGAVFESTLNPATRRSGGMHYTSPENIHKVIDPLFLDDLQAEFNALLKIPSLKSRNLALQEFQNKLASLRFLDPACGSGNFLTETYLSLRRLENKVIQVLNDGQGVLGLDDVIKVSISQFYGIEINDFAVSVAQAALWIAESQMMAETVEIVHTNLDFLPLKSYPNIIEGNALRTDWNMVIPREKLNYIMGNPPFIGYSLQTSEQKQDMLSIYVDEKGKPYKTAGKIDYVAGWYWKAAEMMQGTTIRTALVSTNSITQGEQVAAIWQPLYERMGIHIDFAHRTFRWDSEAHIKAHVHCVIIGFSVAENAKERILFEGDERRVVGNINPYLVDASTVFVSARQSPVCNVTSMLNGGKPTEGGFLILTHEEKEELILKNPLAETLIRPYMMGKDFIERKPRFCLWMVGASPAIIRQCPKVLERVSKVKEYRLGSPKVATQKKAQTPMLFDEVRECSSDYVAIPKVSSENRRYIPMDYLSKEIIPGDKLFMVPSANLYTFGVLTSGVHMAWMRAVCGRLKSDYSYSNTIVYNNFPWPEVTAEQEAEIEKTAQGILDARALYPDCSLADLYDEVTMPIELRKAHQANDKAVMKAYGYASSMTEPEIVADLMKRYQSLTAQT